MEKTIFDATAQPVDGNEMQFDGQRVFHSFSGRPVPLSFLFKGNADEAKSASLVFYVPERIVCRELFASAHNFSDEVVDLKETSVTRHGETYLRYETAGYDLTENLSKTFSVMLTAALDVADTGGEAPADARIDWGYVDEYMLSIYNFHGRNLFNSLNQNLRVLKKPITPIALLSRPHELMSFTTPAGSLSPQQLYQRAVLVASLGCRRMALYPGTWIDGAYHEALGRAARLIWANEHFFIDGHRVDDEVKVNPVGGAQSAAKGFAYVLYKHHEEYALIIFNFGSAEQR